METMKAIAKRKSTRAFDPEKKVAESTLNAILAAGCAAPVGAGDYASLHLTVIQNRETLDKISKAVQAVLKVERDVLYGVPVLVLVSSSEPKFPNVSMRMWDVLWKICYWRLRIWRWTVSISGVR